MARSALLIGAGITGSLTAWRLARAGWNVTVLDARHPGAGSSSRTAAGIRQQFSTAATVLGMRYAVDFYRNFPALLGDSAIPVPIVQNGYLFLYDLAESWEAAKRRVLLQQRLGLREAEALEPAELRRRFPAVDPLAVMGGTFCPTDGFLRPDIVYQEAILAAQRLGAALHNNCPVTGADFDGQGRLQAVRTPAGAFAADVFIDATNAWSPRLSRLLGAAELPIAPLKRYLWMLERAGAMEAAALAALPLVIAPGGAYCRPENAGSLLMGLAHDAAPEPDFSYEDQDRIDPAFFHRSGTDTLGFAAWMALAEVMPALGEFAGITATTSGFYGSTPDHNPFLGFDPLQPRLIRLAGFSGHGAMFGPFSALMGERLAEAGQDVASVEVLDRAVDTGAFRIGRSFAAGEHLVI